MFPNTLGHALSAKGKALTWLASVARATHLPFKTIIIGGCIFSNKASKVYKEVYICLYCGRSIRTLWTFYPYFADVLSVKADVLSVKADVLSVNSSSPLYQVCSLLWVVYIFYNAFGFKFLK